MHARVLGATALLLILFAFEAGAADPTLTSVVPGVSIGAAHLGDTRASIRETLGPPESEALDGTIWEYPSKCLSVSFRDDRVQMVTAGSSTEPEKSLKNCASVSIEGGLKFGASVAQAKEMLGAGSERDIGYGYRGLYFREKGLSMRFNADRLHYVAVSPPSAESNN